MIRSLDARRLPREAQERTRNGADATAERRWENEGGRLPVEPPREDPPRVARTSAADAS
jgi:hypothetical protein